MQEWPSSKQELKFVIWILQDKVFRSLFTKTGLKFNCMFKWVTPLLRLVNLVSSLASTHEFG